ncbi:MAG: acyl-ACP--UDP-N-acetylglucosamine O-acyltransferase [Bosea sp. (in: a-proteobacteria)]
MAIHPTALVAPGARIGQGVSIGPFSVVGPHVDIADNCELMSHVVVEGHTVIGEGTRIHPFVVLGHGPQDLKPAAAASRLTIGRNCILREHVTMNNGTARGGAHTRVGDDCFFMVSSHVAHDCIVGNNVTLVNNVMLAGHCEIGDNVIMGGGSAVHQFTRVGHNAFIGGLAAVEHDVIPFGMALGNRAYLGGLNIIGLKRRGVQRADIHALRHAFRVLFDDARPMQEQLAEVEALYPTQIIVGEVLAFIKARGKRALLTPRSGQRPDATGDTPADANG